MRTERIEETTEANRVAADSAALSRGWETTALVRAAAPGNGRALADGARAARLALVGRVASSAAHDLANVLTAIVGYADLLELAIGSGAGGAELDEIRAAAARGATIVDEVLTLARPEPSRLAQEDEEAASVVDPAALVARLTGMLRRVAGSQVALDLRIEPGVPAVRVEPAALERALLNLVANARQAVEARGGVRGRIEITLGRVAGRADCGRASAAASDAEPRSSFVRVTVKDDGCGMDERVLRDACEPWFTTRARSGGTGLGLADVAALAARCGGRLDLTSAAGAGTEVVLELPAVPALLGAERAVPAAPPAVR